MEYFIFNIVFSIFALTNITTKQPHKESVGIFYIILMFVALIIGLKGIEDEYTRVFVRVPELPAFFSSLGTVAVEKGYFFGLICSVIKTLGGNSQVLFLFFAFTSIYIHGFYYREYTRYYYLAFLIYLSHEIYFKEWVGIRMGLSSALVLPMIWYLVNKKEKKFWLLVLMATTIQYVGILSIALKWLQKRRGVKSLFSGLLLAVAVSYSGIISRFLWYVKDTNLLPEFISGYIGWKSYAYNIGLTHPKVAEQIIILLLCMFLMRSRPEHPSPYFTLFFNIYYFGTICFILLSELAIFAVRINSHFYVVEPLLVISLRHYFVEKRSYLMVVWFGALCVAFINFVYKGRLESYQMFVTQ